MSLITRNMSRIAQRTTRWIGAHYGEQFPFWYVSEYPKCGGTWVSRMVADYLGVPCPRVPLLPLAFPCVIQNHWKYHPKLTRVFYLYRDGRDVFVSFYFYRMRKIKTGKGPEGSRYYKLYSKILGKGFDPENIRGNLPQFIENEMKYPRDCRTNWPDYNRQWHHPARKDIAYLSYEQLREDPFATLKRCLEQLTGEEVDPQRLHYSIDRFRLEKMRGREVCGVDNTGVVRKGVVGDWVNHFTREAAEVFDHYAGDTLVKLGYEADRNWLNRYEFVK